MQSVRAWHALESNPELWRVYIDKLGVNINSIDFIEIYSLDDDYPVDPSIFAFIFLYPDDGRTSSATVCQHSTENSLWTIKQIEELDSCCCLIALLHAIGNNLDKVPLKSGSSLAEFFEVTTTTTMSADERAQILLNNEQIHQAHEQTAEQGQTQMLDSGRIGHHYIAYVMSNDGKLFEMNGSSRGPQAKFIGQSSTENFSSSVIREVKRRTLELNGDIRFSLIGMATQ
jgi:ubiquitin carboxyl-terminal hydrolase L3